LHQAAAAAAAVSAVANPGVPLQLVHQTILLHGLLFPGYCAGGVLAIPRLLLRLQLRLLPKLAVGPPMEESAQLGHHQQKAQAQNTLPGAVHRKHRPDRCQSKQILLVRLLLEQHRLQPLQQQMLPLHCVRVFPRNVADEVAELANPCTQNPAW
jgi:hypothetical protein